MKLESHSLDLIPTSDNRGLEAAGQKVAVGPASRRQS